MHSDIYFYPKEVGSHKTLIQSIETVLDYHRDQLSLAVQNVIPAGHKDFIFEKILSNKLTSLSHRHAALIVAALEFSGILDYDDNDEIIVEKRHANFEHPRIFRVAEENVIRQLLLFKLESKEKGRANETLMAYRSKFEAYGYLHYDAATADYEFNLKELYAMETGVRFSTEQLLAKLFKLKRMCKKAGIKTLSLGVHNPNFFLNLRDHVELMKEKGIRIIR